MEEAAARRGALRWVVIAVAAVLVVAAVVVAVLLTNRSGDQSSRSSGPAQSASAAPAQVTTKVTQVFGRLPAPRRRALQKSVGALVNAYVQAAFVDGRSGTAAFPGFTPAARALASQDARVLTAGPSRIEVKRAAAYVSVFAYHLRAEGATVRLVLALAGGNVTRPRPLVGRLLLTPTASGWRVFGYHVARGVG